VPAGRRLHRRLDGGILRERCRDAVDAEIHGELAPREVRIVDVREHQVVRGDVGEPRDRAEGHRLPVVAAERAGLLDRRLAGRIETRRRVFDGAPRLGIDARRPGHVDVVLRRDELAVLAVEHVEEAVLRRLHQDLAHVVADLDVGEDDRLRRGVVPGFAGRRLEMPDVLARVGPQRHDRRQEPVVAAAGAADALIPGTAVADADVEEIQLGIVGNRIPHGAAAAALPPFAGPGGRGLLEDRILERLRRVSRHSVEAPGELAGLGVVGGDVATHAELRAAVADDHPALDDARRARDRVALTLVDSDDRPFRPARLRVDRDQAPIERAEIESAVPERGAPIDDVAAGFRARLARHLRIELPQESPGLDVEGLELAPGARRVEHAVDFEGRGFLAAVRIEVAGPREAEPGDVRGADFGERAEALLAVIAAIGQPVVPFGGRGFQSLLVDDGRGRLACASTGEPVQSDNERGRRARANTCHSHATSPTSLFLFTPALAVAVDAEALCRFTSRQHNHREHAR